MLVKDLESIKDYKAQWIIPKRVMRVLLIQPPNINGVKSLLSHMGEEGVGIGFKPPIGLLYIATYLKEKTPHIVKIIDAQAERLSFENCLKRVKEEKPDIVGISAWTDWWYPAFHLGSLIKKSLPSAHICYGGPHIAIYPQETLSADHTDSVIMGDGEVPFASLCNMLSNNIMDSSFPGLHFKKYGVKEGNMKFFITEDLDSLPIPDRTILPFENYTSVLGKSDYITTMITSRGCPYHCVFCKLNFQKTLCRSADNVIKEFKNIQNLGISEVEIYDDTFTWSKKRVIDICQGIIDNNINIKWAIRDRVNSVNEEVLDLLKKAGCERIHYGIESGDDIILELMKKNITTDQAREAIKLAKEKKIQILAYYMIGNSHEKIEDIQRTIDFALELDTDYAEFSITIPYPGTELYENALKNGIINNDYWKAYAVRPTPDFLPEKLIEENITRDQLIELRDIAIRRYYFRPKFILREILKVRSFAEFKRKFEMGTRLVNSVMKR